MAYVCDNESCRREAEQPNYASFSTSCDYNGEIDGSINCDCGYDANWCDECSGSMWCSEHDPFRTGSGEVIRSNFSDDVIWVKQLPPQLTIT